MFLVGFSMWFFTLIPLISANEFALSVTSTTVSHNLLDMKVMAFAETNYALEEWTSKGCFRVDENIEIRLCPLLQKDQRLEVLSADLRLQSSEESVLSQLKRSTQSSISTNSFQWISTSNRKGEERGYWARGRVDGLDAAGWLHPEKLEEIAGGPVLVAQPSRDMFCFWPKNSTFMHKNMAVGIKEAYKTSTHPVSAKLYTWNGEHWVVWGEAIQTDSEKQ